MADKVETYKIENYAREVGRLAVQPEVDAQLLFSRGQEFFRMNMLEKWAIAEEAFSRLSRMPKTLPPTDVNERKMKVSAALFPLLIDQALAEKIRGSLTTEEKFGANPVPNQVKQAFTALMDEVVKEPPAETLKRVNKLREALWNKIDGLPKIRIHKGFTETEPETIHAALAIRLTDPNPVKHEPLCTTALAEIDACQKILDDRDTLQMNINIFTQREDEKAPQARAFRTVPAKQGYEAAKEATSGAREKLAKFDTDNRAMLRWAKIFLDAADAAARHIAEHSNIQLVAGDTKGSINLKSSWENIHQGIAAMAQYGDPEKLRQAKAEQLAAAADGTLGSRDDSPRNTGEDGRLIKPRGSIADGITYKPDGADDNDPRRRPGGKNLV